MIVNVKWEKKKISASENFEPNLTPINFIVTKFFKNFLQLQVFQNLF